MGGAVFKLSPSGGTWTETTVYSFHPGPRGDGALPHGVTMDSVGNFYGTTAEGGSNVCPFGWDCLQADAFG